MPICKLQIFDTLQTEPGLEKPVERVCMLPTPVIEKGCLPLFCLSSDLTPRALTFHIHGQLFSLKLHLQEYGVIH